nr:conjugal transfer protein [Anaerostipes caccae]
MAIFFALYSVFTIICGCLSWMFSKQRILMFQMWYQVTAVIWFILAVTVIILLTRLLRLKNEIKYWKE